MGYILMEILNLFYSVNALQLNLSQKGRVIQFIKFCRFIGKNMLIESFKIIQITQIRNNGIAEYMGNTLIYIL